MKAIEVREFGGVENLALVEREEPVPGPGEVVVAVEAAGVNYADVMQRRGLYFGGPKPPFVPGLEVAGTIASVGEGVSNLSIGDPVTALVSSGGYAERVAASAAAVTSRSPDVSAEAGAAFPINFYTADFALHFCGNVREGSDVLVHAAAGGVGTAAVQLAKQAGARVFATASSREKLERVRGLGADVLVDYTKEDFLEVVMRETGGKGVGLVLESVGGEVFEKSVKALRPLGRLVVFGVASSDVRRPDPRDMLFRNLWIIGLHLSTLMQTPEAVGPATERLSRLLASGAVAPQIGQVLPLEEAARAHELLSDRASYGKIVLKP
jgi:NADPH2:quinone reductase